MSCARLAPLQSAILLSEKHFPATAKLRILT